MISHRNREVDPRDVKSVITKETSNRATISTPFAKMDLGELERDEKLYRTSPELLLDFKSTLDSLLWTTSSSGRLHIRRRVRVKDTDRLIGLVELQFPYDRRENN